MLNNLKLLVLEDPGKNYYFDNTLCTQVNLNAVKF